MLKWFSAHLAELIMVAGMAAVSVGVALIYLPAGVIAGGVLAIFMATVSMLGGDKR